MFVSCLYGLPDAVILSMAFRLVQFPLPASGVHVDLWEAAFLIG